MVNFRAFLILYTKHPPISHLYFPNFTFLSFSSQNAREQQSYNYSDLLVCCPYFFSRTSATTSDWQAYLLPKLPSIKNWSVCSIATYKSDSGHPTEKNTSCCTANISPVYTGKEMNTHQSTLYYLPASSGDYQDRASLVGCYPNS